MYTNDKNIYFSYFIVQISKSSPQLTSHPPRASLELQPPYLLVNASSLVQLIDREIIIIGHSTEAEQQPLKRFPDSSVSSLIPAGWCRRASHHQKLTPTFPGIDSRLMVTKRDFLEMNWKRHYDLNERSQNVAKGLST